MIIVLITKGKHASVDYAQVRLFTTREKANEFCTSVNTLKIKYWTKAEIISEYQEIELTGPEE